MSSRPTGPIKQAWYKWKSQRWVPGRKRFLVGLDLHGNTFWEFRDTLNSHKLRMRRIVQYPTGAHLSDVKVSPQWLQWLRHTRTEAPSIEEQSQDVVRQENLKVLAAQADQRWRDKPSVLDAPGNVRGQALPALGVDMAADSIEGVKNSDVEEGVRSGGVQRSVVNESRIAGRNEAKVPSTRSQPRKSRESTERVEEKEDPWKKHQGGPSEQWQPQTWGGGKTVARG